MKTFFTTLVIALTSLSAHAANYDVYAYNNSSGGTGVTTISLAAGQSFTVTANPNDLWSAGALPRFSNANGLTGNLYASAADDSGQSVGTLIGVNLDCGRRMA